MNVSSVKRVSLDVVAATADEQHTAASPEETVVTSEPAQAGDGLACAAEERRTQ